MESLNHVQRKSQKMMKETEKKFTKKETNYPSKKKQTEKEL